MDISLDRVVGVLEKRFGRRIAGIVLITIVVGILASLLNETLSLLATLHSFLSEQFGIEFFASLFVHYFFILLLFFLLLLIYERAIGKLEVRLKDRLEKGAEEAMKIVQSSVGQSLSENVLPIATLLEDYRKIKKENAGLKREKAELQGTYDRLQKEYESIMKRV